MAFTGTYTTPTHDLNSIVKVRVWGDFDTALVAGTTRWSALGSGTSWDDADTSGKTWAQIFKPDVAGQVSAKLLYSEDNTNWSEVDRFEIRMAEVYARYLKVEVTLTDPQVDARLYLKNLDMKAYTGPQ